MADSHSPNPSSPFRVMPKSFKVVLLQERVRNKQFDSDVEDISEDDDMDDSPGTKNQQEFDSGNSENFLCGPPTSSYPIDCSREQEDNGKTA
ncbi:hypothetical protein U1Q18_016574 [Sarracenia purpurea var. burkii]